MQPQMVMYDEEFQQISVVCERLGREANAKVVFLVDKNGQLIASVGQTENLDTTSLASLTAGNIAATLPAVREASEVVSMFWVCPAAEIN